jgi:hypothetical protein
MSVYTQEAQKAKMPQTVSVTVSITEVRTQTYMTQSYVTVTPNPARTQAQPDYQGQGQGRQSERQPEQNSERNPNDDGSMGMPLVAQMTINTPAREVGCHRFPDALSSDALHMIKLMPSTNLKALCW